MAGNLVGGRLSDRVGDISILIIDHDTASLTSMLEKFSTKVLSVDVASKALSMIEEHKDIGLVIANVEMPQLNSDSFLNVLLHNDITLTLLNPKKKNHDTSDLLTNKARFCLNKPISEDDIKDTWEYLLPKNVIDEQKNQMEAFRKSLKRHGISQASLLGKRRPFISTFTSLDTNQQRRNLTDVEWRNNQNCPIEIVNKSTGKKIMENDIGRRCNLWTKERHMNFWLLSLYWVKKKYKAQVDRIMDTFPKNEWKSTDKTFNCPSDYEYPFKATNLRKNLIEANTLWNSLRNKSSSSSSISQFSFKKPDTSREEEMPKLHLGGKFDINIHSHFGNVLNKSSIDVNHVSSSKNSYPPYNHIGLVSTGLGSQNLSPQSTLLSSVGPSNTNTLIQTKPARIFIPQSNPNPFQPPSSTPEIDRNQLERDLTNLLDNFTLPDLGQMGWVPSVGNYSHLESNMNHMDWIPSTDNYVSPEACMNIVSPETNIDPMGCVSSEGYVPLENRVASHFDIGHLGNVSFGETFLPQDDTNMTNVGFVSSEIPLQDNISETLNQYNPQGSYTSPENITCFEANTSPMGLAPFETILML